MLNSKTIRLGPDLARALGRAMVMDYASTRTGFDCGPTLTVLVDTIEAAVTGRRQATINLVTLRPADARVLARACVRVAQDPGPQQRSAAAKLRKVSQHFNLSVVEMVGMLSTPDGSFMAVA